MTAKLLAACVAIAAAGPLIAGPEFPPVAVLDTAQLPPEPIASWLDQVRADAQAGRLAAATGDRDAKIRVLSHVSPGFSCARDFGGVCDGGDAIGRLEDFLRRAGHWEPIEGLPADPADATAWQGVDLSDVSLTLPALLAPLAKIGTGYCTARLTPRSDQRFQAAITALVASPETGFDDELMALYRLNGVLGRWNVRAAPDIAAPVVGQTSDELVFFPGEGEILPRVQTLPDGRSFGWYEVSLHDGTEGYIAVDPSRLMTSLNEGFCVTVEAGRPVISEHIGGGD